MTGDVNLADILMIVPVNKVWDTLVALSFIRTQIPAFIALGP